MRPLALAAVGTCVVAGVTALLPLPQQPPPEPPPAVGRALPAGPPPAVVEALARRGVPVEGLRAAAADAPPSWPSAPEAASSPGFSISAVSVSPEIELDAVTDTPLGDSSLSPPAVAAGNGQYLVVWSDTRRGTNRPNIHAARVDAAGTVLDRVGIPVAVTTTRDQYAPAVAFDGTNFLVVWMEGTTSTNSHIYGARVSGAGAVLDAFPRNLSGFTAAQGYPAVAFDGTNFLVAWNDTRNSATTGNDVYGVRVSASLTLVDPAPFGITVAPGGQGGARLAFNGQRYLVAWGDGRNLSTTGSDIYAARVETDGTVTDPAGIVVAALAYDQGGVAVATGGLEFLVTYGTKRSGWQPTFHAARVADDGTVRDPDGILIATAVDLNYNRTAASFDGARYLIAWDEGGWFSVQAIWLNPDGTLDGNLIPVAGVIYEYSASSPAIASRGGELLLSWVDGRAGGNVLATRVTRAGGLLDGAGVAVSRAGNAESEVDIAAGAGGYLVAWSDNRGDRDPGIYGVRLGPDGAVLDPAALLIGDTGAEEHYPTVTFDGTQYVVAWIATTRSGGTSTSEVRAARVSTAGVVLDPAGISLAPANLYPPPETASLGGVTLVAFTSGFDAHAVRLRGNGMVMDPSPIVLPRTTGLVDSVGVASDDAQWLVVLLSNSYSPDISRMHGVRVSPSGAVLDASPFEISLGFGFEHPSISYGGGGAYLVAWTNSYDLLYGLGDIWAKRVFADGGVPVESAYVTSLSGIQSNPYATHDGVNWVLSWSDSRDGGNIFGARVNPSGVVLDPNGFPIAATADNEFGSAVASAAPGSSVVGFSRSVRTAPAFAARARARRMDDVLPQACAGPGDCSSGFCVDGVCCDTACGGGNPGDCLACSTAAGAKVNGQCGPAAYGTVCRPEAYPCDAVEVCPGGTATTCPADSAATGRSCDDTVRCTTNDRCLSDGGCQGAPVRCTPRNTCYDAGTCDPATGACIDAPRPDGSVCDDYNLCTQTDVCQGGSCVGSNSVTCQPPTNQCMRLTGTCEPWSGTCPVGPLPDFTRCDDGNLCTRTDYCRSGSCQSGTPVTCTPLNECHTAGTCQPSSGFCTHPVRPDGAQCDGGSCLSGYCTRTDAGQPDAGAWDGGQPDGGGSDGGAPAPDGGEPDGGQPAPDGGGPFQDGGGVIPPPDGGGVITPPDGGNDGPFPDGGGINPPPAGCGCTTASGSSLLTLLALAATQLARRRRPLQPERA